MGGAGQPAGTNSGDVRNARGAGKQMVWNVDGAPAIVGNLRARLTSQMRRIFTESHLCRRSASERKPRVEPLEQRALMTTYNIGPGQTYTSLGSFTWSSLQPGDTVDIHWQSGGYHEKLLLTESGTTSEPINIVGVPGPNGELPIIDGENATTSSQFQYFYNPLQEDAVVMITKSTTRQYTE